MSELDRLEDNLSSVSSNVNPVKMEVGFLDIDSSISGLLEDDSEIALKYMKLKKKQ
jgi:hypothetical protein